jgi:hypothetical protein
MPVRFDVVVATVSQRDVPALPDRPGVEPVRRRFYSHPIYGSDLEDLRSFGMRATRWLRGQDGPDRQRARARDVRFPLLDPVLEYLAATTGVPPRLLLVATDQPDEDFRPGDTIELASFMAAVLERRGDRLLAEVDVLPVAADPSDFGAVLGSLTGDEGLLDRILAAGRGEPVRVALASTGGTPALTCVVSLVLAAASGRSERSESGRLQVTELRVRPRGRVAPRGLVDVLGALGLGCDAEPSVKG